MQRVAAVDFGLKRIGLAVSDAQGLIALPLKMVSAGSSPVQSVLAALAPYRKELQAILVGLPLLLNGAKGEMALMAEGFAKALQEASSLPVECIDERLTSKGAERALKEMQRSRKQRTESVDSVAAALLLQTYLDRAIALYSGNLSI